MPKSTFCDHKLNASLSFRKMLSCRKQNQLWLGNFILNIHLVSEQKVFIFKVPT